MNRLLLVLMAVCLLVAGCGGGSNTAAREKQIREISAEVARLRDLDPKVEVPCTFISTDELRTRLLSMFEEEYSREEAQTEQEVYVMLDMMTADQDLYQILLDVYSEQVIGFYDDEADELFVVSDDEELGATEKFTLAHEYTHALQDQHFDLGSLPLDNEDNSDVAIAARSLIEGDAYVVGVLYARENFSESEIDNLSDEPASSEADKFEAAPQFIQKSILFPYEQGLYFVLGVFLAGGWGTVDQAYAKPPQSTEQILHPEKYVDPASLDEPQVVTMPELGGALGGTWRRAYDDIFGEFGVTLYLENFLSDEAAEAAAAGWDGDRFEYWKDDGGNKVLVISTTWDTHNDAQEFFDAYVSYVGVKSGGNWSLTLQDSQTRRWETAGLSVHLRIQDQKVLIIMAPDETIVTKVLSVFP